MLILAGTQKWKADGRSTYREWLRLGWTHLKGHRNNQGFKDQLGACVARTGWRCPATCIDSVSRFKPWYLVSEPNTPGSEANATLKR